MTKYKKCRPINDLVDLVEAIEAGEHKPLPKLQYQLEETHYGININTMEYALLTFGYKGKRQVRTGPDQSLMIEKGQCLLVNESYAEFYCCDV